MADTPIPVFRIDRESSVPMYQQLAQHLEAAIHNGAYANGNRLETELVLAKRLEVARETVRQAIQTLVQKGLVVRRRGSGTAVVHRPLTRNIALTSLYEDLADMGFQPQTRVLYLSTKAGESHITSELGLEPGAEVLRIRRLRYANDRPLAVMENLLPGSLLGPSLADLESHGLYSLLRDAGVTIQLAKQRISAVAAKPEIATLLEIPSGVPVLKIERDSFDQAGQMVELAVHYYRPDLFSYETNLIAQNS